MSMEDQVREAIVSELKRQADEAPANLVVGGEADRLDVKGVVDLEALAMAVVGAVSGGP